ncbi:MAG: MFS transporter [Hyphomonadaceae bacterium]
MSQADAKGRKVSAWEIAAFAAPAAPLLALGLPTILFLPHYYLTDLGLAGGAAIFVLARVLDIFIDPMIGGWQDRTQTRWGRRRFWLVLACPLLMGFIYWAFIGLTPQSGIVAATFAVVTMFLTFSTMMIAHLSWAGELIPTYHGRTRVIGAIQILSLLGQVAILALATFVRLQPGGSDAAAIKVMGWSMIIMLPLTIAIAVILAPERRLPPQPHLTLSQSFRAVLGNGFARKVLGVDLLLGVTQGVAGSLFLFYFQFILGFESQSQSLSLIYFVSGLLGVPFWIWAGRRYGKHAALQGALIYTAATTALIPIAPAGNFPVVAALMGFAGLSQGGGILLTRALMADVVDDDELRTGSRRSGLYFGLLLTTSKAGITAGPLTVVVLQLIGFDATLRDHNAPFVLMALGAAFVVVPIALSLLAALALRNYPLDEKAQAALHAAIEARHAANNDEALGPSTK